MKPMLATLTHEPFSDDDWIYERKFDGERCLAFRKGKRVRLLSRNQKKLNDTYPELANALAKQRCRDFIVDGEVVAFEGKVTSFSRLQGRMQIKDRDKARASDIAVYYYLFDLLHLDGRDTTKLPLADRKQLLKRKLTFQDPVRLTAHRRGDGERFLKEACRKNWEGLIAKKADSRYVHSRSRDWLKFKCGHRQEFVIAGYTDPQGERIGFGALLLGYYADGDLQYAGRVGTGFDDEMLKRLKKKLTGLKRKTTPFAGHPDEDAHWVTPNMVGEVAFTEWTSAGKLRHPRFLSLRRDKEPKEVKRE